MCHMGFDLSVNCNIMMNIPLELSMVASTANENERIKHYFITVKYICFKNIQTLLISVIVSEWNLCLINHYGHKIPNCGSWEPKGCLVYRGYYMVARRYEFYVRVARTRSHSCASLTHEILFLPREHKINIFEPTCNVLFIIWRNQFNKSKRRES